MHIIDLSFLLDQQSNASSQASPESAGPIIDVVQHPAVGNLFLLLASIIGVLGSYLLYKRRQQNRRKKLKRALAFEVSKMGDLDETGDTLEGLSNPPPQSRLSPSKVPPAEALPTAVYESSTSNLGLLSEDEIEAVVNFYTPVLRYKGIIEALREDPQDVPMPDHKALVDSLPELSQDRKELLKTLGYADIIDE